MADNAQKTHYQRQVNRFVEGKVLDVLDQTGKALPCSVVAVTGSIVTVQFDVTTPFALPNVTMPIAGSQYQRVPIQKGDQGITIAADVYLGGVSGLGGGTANTTLPANLSALVFVPVGNTKFPTAGVDPNYYTVYGPDGFRASDAAQENVIQIGVNGAFMVLAAGKSFTIGNVTITSDDVQVSGVSLLNHIHGGVEAGGGNTDPPTA